jgi:hypothetical protein
LKTVERQIATGEKLIAIARGTLKRAIEEEMNPAGSEHVLFLLEAVQALFLDERKQLKKALQLLVN